MPFKNPATAPDHQRDYQRLWRAGVCQTPSKTQVPTEFRLKTAADVVALLEERVRAVRDDATLATCDRARTIGYLAGVALPAIEAGDLVARLEAIVVLKRRNHA